MKALRCCAVFVLVSLFVSLPVHAQFRLAVEGDQVVVRDVALGDRVAIVGVVQEFPGDTMHVHAPFLIGEDEDRDGEVSLGPAQLTRSHLVRAGFVAVELSSGRTAVGAPEGTRPTVGSGARVVMTDERSPRPSAVAIKARLTSALLVRPGVGAWRKIVEDGASSDGDGRGNGTIFLSPASFAGTTVDAPPPVEFLDGDIVVAINTYTREIHVVEIGGSSGSTLSEED